MPNALRLILFACCSLVVSFNTISAQNNQPQTESREMLFRISTIKKMGGDTIAASIIGGRKYGLKKGITGPVQGSYKKGNDRSELEIGFASLVTLEDESGWVLINQVDNAKTNKNYEAKVGDYVKFKITIPKLPYHSTFFELALKDIKFNNLNAKPLYTFDFLILNDSKKIEDSLLTASANDVFETYEMLRDDTNWKHLNEPLKEGRYTGRSVFDVMKNCNAKDVRAFLNYVNNNSKAYIGNTWKMNETFATWIISKAPFSDKEIYDSIMAYKNKPLLLKDFINKNIAFIKEQAFATNWIAEAGTAADKGKEQEALDLFEAAKIILPYLQNDCLTGYYFYQYTGIHENRKEYNKAIQIFDTAYKYFEKCGNDYFRIQTLQNKALIYNTMDNGDEALKVFEKMYAEMNAATTLKPAQKTLFTATYNHFSGVILAAKGELKKAVERYNVAIKSYRELGSYSNLQAAIGVQGRLARLYKKQGELNKALEIYNEQLALYTKLNDKKNIADVLYNIADVEYDLASYRTSILHYRESQAINISFNDLDDAGLSESMIGLSYYNLGNYDSSIICHNQAIAYRRQAGSKSGVAFSWKNLGKTYAKSGDKTKAFIAYDSAAYYYNITKDSVRLRSLLSDIGDVYNSDKQYQKAFTIYYKWHVLNVAAKEKSEMVNSFYQLADASSYFDKDTATKYALQALNLAKEIGDKFNEHYANVILGVLSFKNYDYDKGGNYFKDALNIAITQKYKSQEANCYNMYGIANSSALRFDTAIYYLQKSMSTYQSLNEKTKIPGLLRNIGSTIQAKGDFYEARKYYQQSIDTAYSINNRADVGYGYNSLVFLYIIQGELSKAQAAVDSSYAIFSNLNNSYQIADAYFSKALVYEAKSDGINAVQYYNMADSIYKNEKDNLAQSTCKTNIGAVFYYQTDYKQALKYFVEADNLLAAIKTVTEPHILSPINIGETYYYMKDYAKAEKFLVEGYKLAEDKKAGRMLTIASSFLGTLYYDLKKYEQSEKYLLQSFALAQKSNETDLYINSGMYLGKLYSTINQPAKAQEYYSKTVSYTKTIDNSKYTWVALYEYGLNLYNQQKFDSAAVYFKQAVQIVENSAQNLFGGAEAKKLYNADERKVDLYNKLVAALAKANKADDALYYANKGNTQALKEQMGKSGFVTNDKEKSEAIKKGGELLNKKNAVDQAIAKEKAKPEAEQNKQLIASLESVKNVAEEDYTNFIEQLQRKYSDLQSYFSNTNPKDFRNYIEDIPDSTLVALYIVNDNQLLIFTVTSKETAIKTIDLKQDINKQAARFLSILRNPNNATGTGAVTLRSTIKPIDDVRGDFQSESTDLYNLLITPIADQLKGKKNICVITNGKLGSIPFQCLGIKDDKTKFHFLVEDYAVFSTSKIDIFRKAYKNRTMESSLAVFGNPDKSLPGATREANEIAKIVPTASIFIEEKATEGKAKESLQTFNYIHFATHGVLDYTNFDNSYLLFAPDAAANDDGKLTIKEINGLTKQTNSMVVLSACETAVSKEEVKGWYISPANAFLNNRTDVVISTFWKVPDETTDLILTEFYNNIVNKKMKKVEALRNAQATVSQNPKYSHPFFWGAFVLYGEWR